MLYHYALEWIILLFGGIVIGMLHTLLRMHNSGSKVSEINRMSIYVALTDKMGVEITPRLEVTDTMFLTLNTIRNTKEIKFDPIPLGYAEGYIVYLDNFLLCSGTLRSPIKLKEFVYPTFAPGALQINNEATKILSKKYSEEDLRRAMDMATEYRILDRKFCDFKYSFDQIIASLNSPEKNEWEVELELEKLCSNTTMAQDLLCKCLDPTGKCLLKPKITREGYVNITKII